MPFWTAAQLTPNRTALALHFLQQAGYETYDPLTRLERVHRGRRVNVLHQLFPGYAFVYIIDRWYSAAWAPGVVRLIKDGERPAVVPDRVISELRKRERNGVIHIPRGGFAIGEKVKVVAGPFAGRSAIFAGQSAHERVIVLLMLLGVSRVELQRSAISPV